MWVGLANIFYFVSRPTYSLITGDNLFLLFLWFYLEKSNKAYATEKTGFLFPISEIIPP